MPNLLRVRAGLTGFPGAPGVSTFYFLDVSTAIESLVRFYTALVGAIPKDVTISVERNGDTIDEATGALTGSWVGGVTSPVVGSSVAVYAAPVGFMVGWETGTIADGHRVRGKTYIVPAASSVYGVDGQIIPDDIAVFKAAADQLILEQSASFVVWHRPRKARAAIGTHPAVTAHPGSHALVTASRVPSKAVVLRSRRD